MTVTQAIEMEAVLKESISIGFFEHGTHSDMDLIFYKAYSEIQMLRMILETRDEEIRKLAEELKDEVRQEKANGSRGQDSLDLKK